MSFFVHNFPVFVVAAVLMSFAWVWGGTRGDLLTNFVPWVSFILVEVMVAFPQAGPRETMAMARLRTFRAINSDCLTWACTAFLVLLAIPFVNQTARGLPWCVDPVAHLNVFYWFFPSLLAMIAAKHSLRRRGKRLLMELIVWNGVAMAALGFLQLFTGAQSPFWVPNKSGLVFFSTFGYPNMAGDYFTSLTFLAIGLWRRRLEDVERSDCERENAYNIFWKRHSPLIAVVVLYFAALNSLSRSAILLSTTGVIILFVLAGCKRLKTLDRLARMKFSSLLFFSAVAVTLFALLFTPTSVRNELDTLDTESVLNRMTGKSEYHSRVATELLGDYPLFGCGGWGYMFLSPEKVPEVAKRSAKHGWTPGSANVHNDYLQFLCEHGTVGFVLLVLIVVLAVRPAAIRWKQLALVARFSRHTGLPWPKGFFCFPPMGIAIYASAIATLIHAFGDCPLRSPAILSLFFVQLVCVDGYMPRNKHP